MRRRMMDNPKRPYVIIGGVKWAATSLITDEKTKKGYFAETPETLGSIFQFGRKYGVPSSVTKTVFGQLTIAAGNTFANRAVAPGNDWAQNPSTYHYAWCSETNLSRYDKLWNINKGQYDPCPEGWRVPTKSELDILRGKYVGAHSFNGVKGHLFRDGNNELFIPIQPVVGWGIGAFRTDFLRIMSCELSDKKPYTLIINNTEPYPTEVRVAFMNDGGPVRAVKI